MRVIIVLLIMAVVYQYGVIMSHEDRFMEMKVKHNEVIAVSSRAIVELIQLKKGLGLLK